MITALLIFFAAGCWATAQVLDRHFFNSVFKRLPQEFWYPHSSWKNATEVFRYRIDAWHLLQSAAIVSLIFAIEFHSPILKWWIEIIIGGICWNASFNLFYHKVWRNRRNGA